jgi:membrane peptidoglycan carboxypeptidase
MPTIHYIIRKRVQRQKALGSSPARKAGLVASLVISLGAAFLVIAVSLFYVSLIHDLPSLTVLPSLLDHPHGELLRSTRLYDRTGENLLLALESPAASGRQYIFVREGSENRQDIPDLSFEWTYAPTVLISATLAAEDPFYWSRPVLSLDGFGSGTPVGIAQTLVDELVLWDEQAGTAREVRMRLLAAQATSYYGRARMLEWRLNSARYGPLIYGADAASRAYFGKPVGRLTLSEAAVLAGAARNPGRNPLSNPDSVRQAQREIISAMLAHNLISADAAGQALHDNVTVLPPQEPPHNQAPAYTRLVLEQLERYIPASRLERGGLAVITSLDLLLQQQASCAAAVLLARISSGDHEAVSSPDECQAARLLPTLSFTVSQDQQLFAANAAILEPGSGELLALVGGSELGLDPGRPPGHAPGTLATPFIYLTAFTRGFSPASLVWDTPSTLPISSTGISEPGTYHGPVRLRVAFANDYLAPAIKTLSQVGPENAWRTAQQMGISTLSLPVFNSYLDDESLLTKGDLTLLEAIQSFGVLANQGMLVGVGQSTGLPGQNPLEPVIIFEVRDSAGRIWLNCRDGSQNCSSQSRPIVSSQLAYLITNVLGDETARWPSLGHPNPLEIGRPAAAKIGRTGGEDGAWTVGYTNQLAVGVWLGPAEKNLRSKQDEKVLEHGAAALWHAVIQFASQDLPAESWEVPAGITRVEVCDPSGLLPTQYCPKVIGEIFLEGSEPTHQDTLYRPVQINRETGRLATVFTQPSLIEEQVYMILPPEAAGWALEAGLPSPPKDYDILLSHPKPSPNVAITSPVIFSHVGGQVKITGSAAGEFFHFYRLQIGQGPNPTEWIQIGEDSTKPVKNGLLGQWDASGAEPGLYALRLVVVDHDQRVQTSVIQVTLDNQPPSVALKSPEPDATLVLPADWTIVFKAEASDNIQLQRVEFYLDNQLLASFAEPPYYLAWRGAEGKFHLRVVASDAAGNTSQDSLDFTVKKKQQEGD